MVDQLPQAVNETRIDTAARQALAITGSDTVTAEGVESLGATSAATEMLDDPVSSSPPQSITPMLSTPPSDLGSGGANAESEGSLSRDSDKKANEVEGGDSPSSSLAGASVDVQLSVSHSTESATRGGEVPLIEMERASPLECVLEYLSLCPHLELDPSAAADHQRALMDETARLGNILGYPGAGPASGYPARIDETFDELRNE